MDDCVLLRCEVFLKVRGGGWIQFLLTEGLAGGPVRMSWSTN